MDDPGSEVNAIVRRRKEPVEHGMFDLQERVMEEARTLSYFWDKYDAEKTQITLQNADIGNGTFILRPAGTPDPARNKFLTLSVRMDFPGELTKVWHFPVIITTEKGEHGPPVVYYSLTNTNQLNQNNARKAGIDELMVYHQSRPLKGGGLPGICEVTNGLEFHYDNKRTNNRRDEQRRPSSAPSDTLLLDMDVDVDLSDVEEGGDISESTEGILPAQAKFDDVLVQYVPPETHQFPTRAFLSGPNMKLRACQHSWFKQYPWLHYDITKDFALCMICTGASKKGLYKPRYTVFSHNGFTYWNDGKRKLEIHMASDDHKESIKALYGMPGQPNIDVALDKSVATNRAENGRMLLHVVRGLKFLSRQNLSLRGKYKADPEFAEPDSNLIQLLLNNSAYKPEIIKLLNRKQSYTSPTIQNDLLDIMSDQLWRATAQKINEAKFYSLMIYETTDVSNKEQMVLCLRYVDSDLIVKEDFVSLTHLPKTTSETIFKYLMDELDEKKIQLSNCRGQCYDGAAAMRGEKSSLKSRVLAKNNKAIFVHCYDHALNLAVQDTIKTIQPMRDLLDLTYEITKLIKKLPKRTLPKAIKDHVRSSSSGVRTLCHTRWTVRADCLKSVLENYEELLMLWERSLDDGVSDTDMKARIIGVQSVMGRFDYLMTCMMGEAILRVTDNLAKALQAPQLTASEGQEMASTVVEHLKTLRCDEEFQKLFDLAENAQKELQLSELTVPRKRKKPGRFEPEGEVHFPETPAAMYRKLYYEVIDSAIYGIEDRFNQPGLAIYADLQAVLLKGCSVTPLLMKQYSDDVNFHELNIQLKLISTLFPAGFRTLTELIDWFRASRSKALFSQVALLIRLLMVMPATNATSERSFSTLRRVKTYLRSTMTETRLSSLMRLHIYKEETSRLVPREVVKEYINRKKGRASRIAI